MPDPPDEINLEFGLSLSAEANLVVATTATQANFTVALTWRRPAEPARSGEAEHRSGSGRDRP